MNVKPEHAFWAGLVTYVFFYDAGALRKGWTTGSGCWERWLQTPQGKAACVGAWGWLTLHLFLQVPLPGQKTICWALTGQAPEPRIQFHQHKKALLYLQSVCYHKSNSSLSDPILHTECSTN